MSLSLCKKCSNLTLQLKSYRVAYLRHMHIASRNNGFFGHDRLKYSHTHNGKAQLIQAFFAMITTNIDFVSIFCFSNTLKGFVMNV